MIDTLIIGSGLAGLTTAMDLVEAGLDVTMLERHKVVGGRTASWLDDGMPVESGLHRWLGFYAELPKLLEQAGIDHNDILHWGDEVEIRLPDGGPRAVIGLSPLHKPIKTITGLLGNNDLLSPIDKAKIVYFFTRGLADYATDRLELDRTSVKRYAREHGLSKKVIDNMLVPLTEGIFFLPPDQYSAMVLMGLLVPSMKRAYALRVGSFLGGMTEVMAQPIADAIERKGGQVLTEMEVEKLAVHAGRVYGAYVGGELIEARHVVVATALSAAQRLIGDALPEYPWFEPMLDLPSNPAVTLQIEFDEPTLPSDHTMFSPHTLLASYAEQSRTTFRHVPGRLSIDVGQSSKYINADPETIFRDVMADARRLGLNIAGNVRRYRVVSHPADFYALSPGTERLRPPQKTPVPGLSLAGDYTAQPLFATMEGAVHSGRRAAKAVKHALMYDNGRLAVDEPTPNRAPGAG
jgi:15-cis-phytoene desaturase